MNADKALARAEKIVAEWDGMTFHGCSGRDALKSMIATQIHEAEKEAFVNGKAEGSQVQFVVDAENYAKGRAAGLEEAAKAVEFQVGKSLETPFDRALVDGAISVIRAIVL